MSGGPGLGGVVGGFVIEAVAGRGGMGVVYRARQSKPDRLVALKVIAPDLAGDPAFRARFERESTIAAQIEHPNVIPVHAVGEDGGVLFIAMRFVAGIDLRSLIAQEGRLEARRAAAIVDQVAQALDAAHGHGLVHRDVKPANILLAGGGGRDHVYLTDFGLSRHVEGSQGMTGTGAFLGTIDYVAPEQARGDRVDARTDVYSLGCVLFHALTGSVPFPLTNDLAKLYAHGTQEPPSVRERAPGVPDAFDPVLTRAMAKAPEDRYLSAGDLGRAATAAATNTALTRTQTNVATGGAAPPGAAAVPAGPPPPAPPAPPAPEGAASEAPRRRRRAAPVLAGVLGLGVLAAVAALALGGGGSPARRTPPPGRRAPAQVGFVRGRSIGPVVLGQLPATVTPELTRAGYTLTRHVRSEDYFSSPSGGNFVVDYFDNGRVNQVHKYNDPTISIGGVSIASTLRQARAALPAWRVVRCPVAKRALLVAPGGHTFFELPLDPNATNVAQANGIDVISSPVDRAYCG